MNGYATFAKEKEFKKIKKAKKLSARSALEKASGLGVKKVKKPNRQKLEKELDKEWSLYIRNRDKFCQMCGSRKSLAAHHAFGRVHRATRWDIYCGVAVCWPCHKFRCHGDPAGFTAWFKKHVGENQFNRLDEVHKQITKFTLEDLQKIRETIKSLDMEDKL